MSNHVICNTKAVNKCKELMYNSKVWLASKVEGSKLETLQNYFLRWVCIHIELSNALCGSEGKSWNKISDK